MKSSATSVSPGAGGLSASQTSVRAPSTTRTRASGRASGRRMSSTAARAAERTASRDSPAAIPTDSTIPSATRAQANARRPIAPSSSTRSAPADSRASAVAAICDAVEGPIISISPSPPARRISTGPKRVEKGSVATGDVGKEADA